MTVPSFVVVLPAIDPDLTRTCIASMCSGFHDRVAIVDNTVRGEIFGEYLWSVPGPMVTNYRNIGVAESWNHGIGLARQSDTGPSDYLVILSQSITFGPSGGRDFLAELDQRRPKHIMHSQWGWHLLAINMDVIERVGMFDTAFPHYGTDTDYLYRMGLAGLPSPRENGGELDQINVDATCRPNGETLRRGLIDIRYEDHLDAYRAKWLGPQGAEQTTHPYDDPTLDWTYTGEPKERG